MSGVATRMRATGAVVAACLALLLLGALLPASAQTRVGPSGLPLPRFVALANGEVNVRTGPGRQYPIRYVLIRKDLPVKIVDEFDTWRQIQDFEGEEGWVHSSLLSSKRTILLQGQVQDLHRAPEPTSRVILRAEPGVLGTLIKCQDGWCEVDLSGSRGWMQSEALWGVLPQDDAH